MQQNTKPSVLSDWAQPICVAVALLVASQNRPYSPIEGLLVATLILIAVVMSIKYSLMLIVGRRLYYELVEDN